MADKWKDQIHEKFHDLSDAQLEKIWDEALAFRGSVVVAARLMLTNNGDNAPVRFIVRDPQNEPIPPRAYVEEWLGRVEKDEARRERFTMYYAGAAAVFAAATYALVVYKFFF